MCMRLELSFDEYEYLLLSDASNGIYLYSVPNPFLFPFKYFPSNNKSPLNLSYSFAFPFIIPFKYSYSNINSSVSSSYSFAFPFHLLPFKYSPSNIKCPYN